MIHLTESPIDAAGLIETVRSPAAGAVVLFLGTARQTSGGRQTSSLEYECYAEMAQAKLAELERDARARWALVDCALVHRLGHLAIGEIAVAIAVSSPHRQAAFQAGNWLIDRIKEVVPLWKKENWADGTSEWIHPALDNSTQQQGDTNR